MNRRQKEKQDMKDISVEDEAISDTLEDATGDIEITEAHGSDDDMLQEDSIAKEASSDDAIEDANSDQVVAESDGVSNQPNIHEQWVKYTGF